MKPNHKNRILFAALTLALTVSSAIAATLTLDTTSGDGATITPGSGNWNTTAGNLVWNNAGTNVIWSQTSATVATNAATFAGADGSTPDEYVVTLSGTTNAQSVTFSNSGYKLTAGTLTLLPTATSNGAITVAAGKTATINSAITYAGSGSGGNYPAAITVNAGSTLNLGGGATNAQYTFLGAGTVNVTAGSYSANTGAINVATFNQTGGTFNITPGNGIGYNINSNTQNVTYNLSGGTLSVNGNANAPGVSNSFLGIGFSANASSLNVSGNSTMNVGTTASRSGEIRIGNTNTSKGTLNVTGGTVTVGTGSTANKIYFHKAGSGAAFIAAMTQSAGTVTTNGIQFGGSTGATTYNATSAANLTLSGGSLYIGLQGITRGTDANALPVAIKLQGGILGASDTWSSSLDMKLGAGTTIQAATSAAAAKNITLSGILSDDSGAGTLTKTGAGTLTLSGANTFTGATTVNAGALVLGNANAVSTSSSLTLADGAALSLTTTPSTVQTLTFTNNGTLNFDLASGGTGLTVSTPSGVTNSGATGSIAINITGSAPANGTYSLISYSGSLGGSGFSAYTLGTTPAGKTYTLSDTGSAIQVTVVADGYYWTGTQSSEWSTATIAGSKNWILDGNLVDYVNGGKVVFDGTATNKTVNITGADVTPLSVLFNSGNYTLQGTNKIAGTAPITVTSAATLKLGTSNVLPDGVGAGTLSISGTLDLNGNSETLNGFSGTGSVDNTAVSTTSTLTLGAIVGGTSTGNIKNTGGTLALTKTGATDVILSGNNTYSGATTVSQSRLFINGSAALSPNTAVTVSNGASLVLTASGTPTFAQSITLASGSNLSVRQASTVSNATLPIPGTAIFNNDDQVTAAFTLSTPTALTDALTVQVGGGVGAPGVVTLTGILSGSGGSLVKTGAGQLALGGANTFVGGVTIKNGTLESKTTKTTLGANTVTMGGAGSTGASYITGQDNSNPFIINAPDSGTLTIGANGSGSGFYMSGGITLNGNLTLQSYNNVISGSTTARSYFTGGITGTGNLLLDNLGLAANAIELTTTAVNHTGSITVQGSATGVTLISAPIGSNVTGITQNSATSRLDLSGANTYVGNLTVNAGAVRISNNSNTGNDASTVTLAASGATLDLTYVGTDTVDKLYIGSTQQANGVYGKVGSALPVIGISQITGDGTLTVSSGPAGYSSWITGTFANGTVPALQQGANADPDNDGISNLLEYAIAGQDPTVANAAVGTFAANVLSYTKRAGTNGLTYAIQKSTDLGTTDPWIEVTGGSYVNDATTISFTLTPGTPAKNFLRLKVLSN
ncbi:MAG: autotransporter-associated beta strand repeat-containing protein [Akkermansiaceae bacterium]|nr:autotransporter-associated beta strand repeat-containing protein [Akkermansiaceae bacterium]